MALAEERPARLLEIDDTNYGALLTRRLFELPPVSPEYPDPELREQERFIGYSVNRDGTANCFGEDDTTRLAVVVSGKGRDPRVVPLRYDRADPEHVFSLDGRDIPDGGFAQFVVGYESGELAQNGIRAVLARVGQSGDPRLYPLATGFDARFRAYGEMPYALDDAETVRRGEEQELIRALNLKGFDPDHARVISSVERPYQRFPIPIGPHLTYSLKTYVTQPTCNRARPYYLSLQSTFPIKVANR